MRGLELERSFLTSRRDAKTELVFFVNAGDPRPEVTFDMLRVLAQHKVAAVELCVPFPKSLTDGSLIRESHQRALSNGIALPTVLELIARARDEFGLAIVLLADYRHTVEPLGLERFLQACFSAGAYATLIHCLPPARRQEYVEQSAKLGLGRIMSFFVGSEEGVRKAAYQEAEGFIYVVSRFGRTGQKVSFNAALLDQLVNIRSETEKPLAVGFGVKTANDISTLRSTGADALVIGSAATAVVQNNIDAPERIAASFDDLVRQLAMACAANPSTHHVKTKSVG
jgi:tryptophan synthase alpha chain